jgi:hypothetical protein
MVMVPGLPGPPFGAALPSGTVSPIYYSHDWKPTLGRFRRTADTAVFVFDLDLSGAYVSKRPIDLSTRFKVIHGISWDGLEYATAGAGTPMYVPIWSFVSAAVWAISLYGGDGVGIGAPFVERPAGNLPRAFRYVFTATGRPAADGS